MPDILEIARRHLKRLRNESDERNEISPPEPDLITSNSSISSPAQTWGCQLEAVHKLLAEGDALVGELGVPGIHPLVVRAAEEVASAIAFCDFPTLRHAVGEFKYAVRCAAHGNTPWHCIPIGWGTKETK